MLRTGTPSADCLLLLSADCHGVADGVWFALYRGSGKTTQVPQYLLEAASESGAAVNVLCTQPRRISAIGVAERVAAERGEAIGQGAVGYAVRGESRQSASTSLLFCTTGVLLRMLEHDPSLANVSHVLVDEVHER